MSCALNYDWQEWVVLLLILFCILWIGVRILTFSRRMKKNNNPCDNCASGCALKTQLDKKKQECKANPTSGKKKCCG